MGVVANVGINFDAKNAIQNANALRRAIDGIQPTTNKATAATGNFAVATKSLGAAIQSALGPILTVTAAIATLKKGLDVAFTRGAAEQKLRNFTSSTEEFNAAMAVAANSSAKFGISQTEATVAIADTLSRLKGLGFGLKETSQIYDGFNAIAMESGTSAEDAAGAFVQLSQALGSGKLQGDELRSILERMPNLAQKIATSMGRSAAEVRSLGQEGALTSEVIYKALSEAAEGADNFGDKLNEQQQAQKGLAQVSDRLFNSIGQAFGPIVLKSIEAITWASNEIADWWDYLGGVILPKLAEAVKPLTDALKEAFSQVDIKALVTIIQSVFIKSLETSISVIGKMSEVLGFVVNKLREMADNPVFRFIAEQVGRLLNHLGLTTDKVGEFATKQKEVTAEAAKTVDQFSAMPDKIESAKDAQKRLRKETKALEKAQKEVNDKIKAQTAEIERQFSVRSGLLSLQADLKQEQIKSELELNSLMQDRLKFLIQNAKTDQELIHYAKQLRELQKQSAQLEYQSAIATITLQLRKVELAYEEVKAKEKAVSTEVARAKAAGIVNKHHLESLRLVKEEVSFGAKQLDTARQIAKEQVKQAEYALKAKNRAAELAYLQNLIGESTNKAANEAGRYANNMSRAGAAAGSKATTTTVSTSMPIDPDIEEKVQSRGNFRSVEAMVGALEKAQRERNRQKIVQERRSASSATTASAMNRYSPSGGSQGSSSVNPTVNVTTGPVMNMDGQNYVSQNDFVAGLQSASTQGAEMALKMITSSGGARRDLGVG